MNASDLSSRLAPYAALINKQALSINYRSLFLGPTSLRACSQFGAMETELATGLNDEVYVDGDAFLQVVRSLAVSGELEMQSEGGVLRWKCGKAQGRLAVLSEKVTIHRPTWPEGIELEEVGEQFGLALELGGMACGTTALLSVGIYGIQIENEAQTLRAYASDNATMSTAYLGAGMPKQAAQATLSPDGVRLLTMLANHSKLSLAIDDTSVYCQTPDTRLLIKQVSPLKFQLGELMRSYLGGNIRIELDRAVISSFIRRAEALAEDRGKAVVTMAVQQGTVQLTFYEDKASSEEYYLASGPDVSVDPIVLDARRLAKVLSRSTHIVFDFSSQGAVVLVGEKPEFAFVISGKSPASVARAADPGASEEPPVARKSLQRR